MKDLKKNITMSPFTLHIMKRVKKCHKNLENRLINKSLMPENNLNRAFSIVKRSAREVTVFPEKNLDYFSFKMHQTKTKLSCVHS